MDALDTTTESTPFADAASTDPDAALMMAVQAGDNAAFAALFDKYKRKVITFARGFVRNQARAEDAAQEVFMRVYAARASYEPRTKFCTYLYRITANTCINYTRKREATVLKEAYDETSAQSPLLDTHFATPDEALSGVELKRVVDEALSRLSDTQRIALSLLRAEEMSYGEIAQVMQLSESSVKAHLNRARAELLRMLGDHLGGYALPYAPRVVVNNTEKPQQAPRTTGRKIAKMAA